MVSNNGDWVRHSLNVLPLLSESKDDCKEFVIINIIVMFSQEESAGEVSTGVNLKITIGIGVK